MNIYNMRPAEQINEAISQLPKAELCELQAQPCGDIVYNFRTVRVTDNKGKVEFVDCPTNRYRVIQHEQAFRPIIEGLTQASITDFKFITHANHKNAQLQVYVDSAGYDTVSLGFKVENSFNRSKALSFGFTLNKSKKWIEIVGYRQVCSNGMKIRVPLEQAEIIKPELQIKLTKLIDKKTTIKHTESANEKLLLIQYTVEALSLLRNPIELMIKKGQEWKIEHEELLQSLVLNHVSKRYRKRVLNQYYEQGDDSLWGLYNAITFVASHDSTLKDSGREKLLDASANLLLEEVKA